jgi:Tfp pilus assembly protein PilV
MITTRNVQKGFGMIEIIVGASLILVIGGAAVTAWSQYLEITQTSITLTRAAIITEEIGEMLVVRRDTGWATQIATYSLDTDYYVSWNGSAYVINTATAAFQGDYAVKFRLSSVNRDANSNVVNSGGTTDTGTLKAQITVASIGSLSTALSTSELLLHNVYSN